MDEEFFPADQLLSRTPDQDYIREWTGIVQNEKKAKKSDKDYSLLLFRIHNEWFGLSTSIFNQVCERKAIHSIPFRKNPLILGLVNIGGQIRVCVAMDKVLSITGKGNKEDSLSSVIYDRMIVIESQENVWVFPVDEVCGIFQFDRDKMENVPVNVAKSSANFLRGIFSWKGKSIGFLDEKLLCYSLKTSI